VTCSCGNVSVDGGTDYLKRCFKDISKVEELSIQLAPHVVDSLIEKYRDIQDKGYPDDGVGSYFLPILNEAGVRTGLVPLFESFDRLMEEAVSWAKETKRNDRGAVYAVLRALRDLGVDFTA
jgi:hypothetical protein